MWWGTILSSSADRYPAGIFLYIPWRVQQHQKDEICRLSDVLCWSIPFGSPRNWQLDILPTAYVYTWMTVVTFLKPPSSTAAGKSLFNQLQFPCRPTSLASNSCRLTSHCALKMSATTTTLLWGPPPSISGGWTWLIRVAKKFKNRRKKAVGCCVQIIDIYFLIRAEWSAWRNTF